jgi:predicted TIM-barrel fold metal-dependent hydrolase
VAFLVQGSVLPISCGRWRIPVSISEIIRPPLALFWTYSMSSTRIDVHAHFLPSFYRDALIEAGLSQPDGMPAIPQWSEQMALSTMDRLGIETALLSISSPGVHFGDDAKARSLARRVNEEGARLMNAHPGRFGLFASLPVPDIDGALRELEYAMDVLKADGVVLETNHGGVYLGDAKLEPLYAELNRRKAVIFVHPTSPSCTCCDSLSLGYPRPMLEFMFETTRSITNLLLSGAPDRHADLRVIVPHAGAALPVLADRVVRLMPILGDAVQTTPEHFFALLRRLYYDLAGAPIPRLLPALLEIADAGHIMYGSDWPFTPPALVESLASDLDGTEIIDADMKQRVLYRNAAKLFPRLGR